MSILTFTKSDNSTKSVCAAKTLSSTDRQNIAIQALGKTMPITELADQHGTSRKFVYQQKEIGSQALRDTFEQKNEESDVLFYLPITKRWLRQLVISLLLICRCSYRGVVEIFKDLFDCKISVGSVHNIAQDAVSKAKDLNAHEDLSPIKIGSPDEIFQGNKPVLAGCDVESLYCYLLQQTEHRDGDTWAIHLMECQDKGLNLDYTIGDFGNGLRAGQNEAMPDTPCLGDHFHVLYEMGKARTYLDNRAHRTIKACDSVEKKMGKAKKKGKGNKFSKKLAAARAESIRAVNLADDFGVLTDWMQEILSPIGPDFRTREEMFNFIVEELRSRESLAGKHRIVPVRRILENNKEEILSFARLIDHKWETIAEELGVDDYLLRRMYELQNMPYDDFQRYKLEKFLRQRLRGKFYFVQDAISKVGRLVERASSAIENFNSRLRNYFFLRKQLGPDYLDLLRFFLNQRHFLASEDPRRTGHSPAELMLGENQPHWLEQLGFQLFKRVA